jgi:hypothetical protein
MEQSIKGEYIKIEKAVGFSLKRIRKGYSKERILRELRKFNKKLKLKGKILNEEDIFEIARNRIRAKEKFGEFAAKLFFDEDGLRYSTPPSVAEYRAKRLKTNSIADVSCGVGSQLVYFAKESEKAVGVELDRKRAYIAKLNLMAMGEDAEIIVGDALSEEIIKQIDAEIVFSDPSRPPQEEVRSLENLEPPPEKVIERYSKITSKIAFELPPQLPPERIPIEGEKEYTSLNFRLNRLALYCNELAECELSAVSIPSMERVTNEIERIQPVSDGIKDFLHEVDFTIIKAGLLPNLLGKLDLHADIVIDDGKRVILSSNTRSSSNFVKDYFVEEVCNFSFSEINDKLKKLRAGKITLRFSLPPSDYWEVRTKLESGLEGEEWLYLFKKEEKAIIARLLD